MTTMVNQELLTLLNFTKSHNKGIFQMRAEDLWNKYTAEKTKHHNKMIRLTGKTQAMDEKSVSSPQKKRPNIANFGQSFGPQNKAPLEFSFWGSSISKVSSLTQK